MDVPGPDRRSRGKEMPKLERLEAAIGHHHESADGLSVFAVSSTLHSRHSSFRGPLARTHLFCFL
jgi:hypothetical protein